MCTNSTTRFDHRVGDYTRFRPGYPTAVLDHLAAHSGLGPSAVVADIGAGTGILTGQLLPRCAAVFAVEPNESMRRAAEERLALQPGFRSLPGSAEQTLLADRSMDLVCAAQAFHWFDQAAFRRECERILVPDARVALLWNERELLADPFAAAYEGILVRHATSYQRVRRRYTEHGALAHFFGHDDLVHFSCPNVQRLDFEGLLGRMRSSSYCPRPDQGAYRPLVAELRELHADHADADGRVSLRYTTNCLHAPLR